MITNVIAIAIALSSRMWAHDHGAERTRGRYRRDAEHGPHDARAEQGEHTRAPAFRAARRCGEPWLPRGVGRGDSLRGGVLDGCAVLQLRRQGGSVPRVDGA